MRGIENKELTERLQKAWQSGKYKSYSSLARTFHLKHPKIVERAIKKQQRTPEVSRGE